MAVSRTTDRPAKGDAPPSLQSFPRWLKKNLKYDTASGKIEYSAMAALLRNSFQESKFWSEFCANLRDYDEKYKLETGYDLFFRLETPQLLLKSYDSFLNKIYRNIFIKKDSKISVADCEKIDSAQLYSSANDIVRTLVIVKYLDGVERIVGELDDLCSNHTVMSLKEFKCNDDGYYAAHFYVFHDVDYPTADGPVTRSSLSIEIQITTQLQEVLRKVLHKSYEQIRSVVKESSIPWQWRYKEDGFITNYLGHTLHNIEGLLMKVRK